MDNPQIAYAVLGAGGSPRRRAARGTPWQARLAGLWLALWRACRGHRE
ncbi:MAG: hypothetical protein O9284_06230 [Steroidobacteraceae bacterium]|jgi:hypothetical protein|nr:hypothetical protein [Steroidobacteraceae bacterium]